ncbi:hypothetical protein [Moraxella bovis]|nr:hypothetical protein [Moraxella bovis]
MKTKALLLATSFALLLPSIANAQTEDSQIQTQHQSCVYLQPRA